MASTWLALQGTSLMRRVFLDPDGTLPYLFGVIVEHPTGVTYQQQCGGTDCVQRSAEGYFVPLGGVGMGAAEGVFDPAQLTDVFHRGSWCVWGGEPQRLPPNVPALPADRLDLLRALVGEITYWTSADQESDQRAPLRLDDARLGDLVEAWAPVLTPDGPGVLVWENCD